MRAVRVGRPSRRKAASTSYVTIRCTKAERLEWHRLAKREGLALAALLRRELERIAKRR